MMTMISLSDDLGPHSWLFCREVLTLWASPLQMTLRIVCQAVAKLPPTAVISAGIPLIVNGSDLCVVGAFSVGPWFSPLTQVSLMSSGSRPLCRFSEFPELVPVTMYFFFAVL